MLMCYQVSKLIQMIIKMPFRKQSYLYVSIFFRQSIFSTFFELWQAKWKKKEEFAQEKEWKKEKEFAQEEEWKKEEEFAQEKEWKKEEEFAQEKEFSECIREEIFTGKCDSSQRFVRLP